MTITRNFKRFQYFDFKANFLKNEKLFLKTEVFFLDESTKIENATFPYKTLLREANVKTNRMGSKWTYHKGQGFASNYFIFQKICFSRGTSYKELIGCTNYPNVHIHTFRKR